MRLTGKNNSKRREFPDEIIADVKGMQFAIDAHLPHPAGNELGVLGTEIENEDFVVGGHRSKKFAGNFGRETGPGMSFGA